MDRIDLPENLLAHTNDFEFGEFVDGDYFNQITELIQGESACPSAKLSCDGLTDGGVSGAQFPLSPATAFGCDYVSSNFFPYAWPNSGGDAEKNVEEEDMDGEEDSSGTTTTNATTPTKKTKADRSRTLISERRRRGRMKEKLYALRSLVPNITKMDKASIIGDAVLYVQELQVQAKKLKTEVANLEASLAGQNCYQSAHTAIPKEIQVNNNQPICRKILQMDAFQVEERGFYVRLVCNKGVGVAVSLYRALEALKNLHVKSSNLACTSKGFTLTVALNVRDSEQDVNLPHLKLCIAEALLNQGFEFQAPLSA